MGYRRNRATNPVAGIDTTKWVAESSTGTTTASRVALAGVGQPVPGVDTVFQAVVATGTPTYLGGIEGGAGDIAVTAGETIVASVYGRITSGAAGLALTAILTYYNASNAVVGSAVSGSAVATTSGTWKRASVSGVVPATAVRATVTGRLSTSGTFAVGNTAQVTGVLVESGSTVSSLFVPGVTPGAFWDAGSNASTSTLYAFAAPTVTTTDEPPTAHVVWTAADLADNVATLTLYRQYDGQTTTQRSSIDAFAAGGYVVDDPEVPPGVPVTYTAEVFRADGQSLGYTPGTTVQTLGEVGICWLSDPLDPATAPIRVELRVTAGAGGKTEAPGGKYRAGLRTVALLAPRGLLENVDMSFYTDTLDQYKAVMALVASSNGVILFRTAPPITVPRLLYAWAKAIVPDEFNLPAGLEDFEFENPVDQLSPIEGRPFSSLTPWSIYIAAFPTWADFNAAYLTWFDAIDNPPEA